MRLRCGEKVRGGGGYAGGERLDRWESVYGRDRSLIQRVNYSWKRRDQVVLCYETEETDPLPSAPRNSAQKGCLARGGVGTFGWMATAAGKFDVTLSTQLPFRLCFGPDLMKEKGLKK